jgi:hypothetical protein
MDAALIDDLVVASGPFLRFSLLISLLAGKMDAETGSITTASATTQFLSCPHTLRTPRFASKSDSHKPLKSFDAGTVARPKMQESSLRVTRFLVS